MSYEGGRLRPWFGRDPNDRFCRRACERGADAFKTNVETRTPIDTGRLRSSYATKPVARGMDERGDPMWTSGVETDVEYAPYVEHGTGLWGPQHRKYEIRPKDPDGTLHWVDPRTGRDVFAKRVMHPGSPGAHMFSVGAAATEAELPALLNPLLVRWAREVEIQNRTGIGRRFTV